MSKPGRKRKLELLKSAAASLDQARKLNLEKQIGLVQTKMLENELQELKQQLEQLKQKRDYMQTAQAESEKNNPDSTTETP